MKDVTAKINSTLLSLRRLLFNLIIFMIIWQGHAGAIITVSPGGSIQEAIDNANPGEIINVESGTYEGEINVSKRLSLIGIDSGKGAPKIETVLIFANGSELIGFEVEAPTILFGIAVNSNNCSITDNKIKACTGCILLKDCNGNTIARNEAEVVCQGLASLLKGDGIQLMNSHNNIIKDNAVENCFIGIYLDSSSHNLVENNSAQSSTNGVGLLTAVGNTIRNNSISDASMDGLGILKFSNDNVVTGNTIEHSADYGIKVQDSSNNAIYLNNFRDNKLSAVSKNVRSTRSINKWHSPENIAYSWANSSVSSYLGNFWSDCKGADSDNDGIVNDHYEFEGDRDDYPLAKQSGEFKA